MTRKQIFIRIGLVVLFLLVAVGMGYLLYRIFFAPIVSPGGNENINTPYGTLPPTNVNMNAGVIIRNVNGTEEVILPSIDDTARGGNTIVDKVEGNSPQDVGITQNGLMYYDKTTGEFYRIDDKGNKTLLTDKIYKSVENVNWNPNGKQAILEFPDGSNVLYDFTTKQQATLPKELEEFSFSKSGDEIAFKFLSLDEEDNWLGVAAPDGSGARGLELLGDNESKLQVDWSPSGQTVALMNESINAFDNEITFIGLNGENFKGTIVKGRGFEFQWSPNGDKLLYSVYSADSDYKPQLWMVDAYGDTIGNNRVDLGVETWSDKCTFGSGSAVYCAVPQQLDLGAGMAPGVADNTPDIIYQMDLNTGTRSVLANPVGDDGTNHYTVDNMYVSNDGQYLYFVDKNTGDLNKIKIK